MGKDLEDFLRSAMAPNDEAPASVYPLFLFGDLQQGGRGGTLKEAVGDVLATESQSGQ